MALISRTGQFFILFLPTFKLFSVNTGQIFFQIKYKKIFVAVSLQK